MAMTPASERSSAAGSGSGAGELLAEVARRAAAATPPVFGPVRVENGVLRCDALASAEPAEYRMFEDAGKLWVALVTAHRWLSQSIEADLVHTGDKIEELVEEELVDLGWDKGWGSARLPLEHFRDVHKLYTFRTPVPVDMTRPDGHAIEVATMCLLGYERAFRVLGDMEGDEED